MRSTAAMTACACSESETSALWLTWSTGGAWCEGRLVLGVPSVRVVCKHAGRKWQTEASFYANGNAFLWMVDGVQTCRLRRADRGLLPYQWYCFIDGVQTCRLERADRGLLPYQLHCLFIAGVQTCRLQRADATLTDRDERLRAADYQYVQLNEAYNDLRENYDVLRTETQAMGAKQQLGVSDVAGFHCHMCRGVGPPACLCVCVCVYVCVREVLRSVNSIAELNCSFAVQVQGLPGLDYNSTDTFCARSLAWSVSHACMLSFPFVDRAVAASGHGESLVCLPVSSMPITANKGGGVCGSCLSLAHGRAGGGIA
eukprot:scaffold134010_cov23-Tisochrysis_lutea.AAC.1